MTYIWSNKGEVIRTFPCTPQNTQQPKPMVYDCFVNLFPKTASYCCPFNLTATVVIQVSYYHELKPFPLFYIFFWNMLCIAMKWKCIAYVGIVLSPHFLLFWWHVNYREKTLFFSFHFRIVQCRRPVFSHETVQSGKCKKGFK